MFFHGKNCRSVQNRRDRQGVEEDELESVIVKEGMEQGEKKRGE